MNHLSYLLTQRDPASLQLGIQLRLVHYDWRPFEERLPAHQLDYIRLRHDIAARMNRHEPPLINPLICFRGAVLIGMRRCEIARELRIREVPCWEIQDDIENDPDASRVMELKARYAEARY